MITWFWAILIYFFMRLILFRAHDFFNADSFGFFYKFIRLLDLWFKVCQLLAGGGRFSWYCLGYDNLWFQLFNNWCFLFFCWQGITTKNIISHNILKLVEWADFFNLLDQCKFLGIEIILSDRGSDYRCRGCWSNWCWDLRSNRCWLRGRRSTHNRCNSWLLLWGRTYQITRMILNCRLNWGYHRNWCWNWRRSHTLDFHRWDFTHNIWIIWINQLPHLLLLSANQIIRDWSWCWYRCWYRSWSSYNWLILYNNWLYLNLCHLWSLFLNLGLNRCLLNRLLNSLLNRLLNYRLDKFLLLNHRLFLLGQNLWQCLLFSCFLFFYYC